MTAVRAVVLAQQVRRALAGMLAAQRVLLLTASPT
jgi:hypothetical protein